MRSPYLFDLGSASLVGALPTFGAAYAQKCLVTFDPEGGGTPGGLVKVRTAHHR
jgi:hypothetical protein